MRVRNVGFIGGLIACVLSAPVYAQMTDRSFTTTSNTCSGVRWSESVLKQYPGIADACQSVEVHNGVTYVKFSGTVLRTRNQGQNLTLDIKDGTSIEMAWPENAVLSLDGRETPVSRLQTGQKLNFYVPQNQMVAQFYPEDQTPSPAARPVVARIEAPASAPVAARTETPTPAMRTAEREPIAEALPGAASELPLFALTGLIMLGLGAGLTVYRRRQR